MRAHPLLVLNEPHAEQAASVLPPPSLLLAPQAALAQVAGVCRGKGVAAGNFAVTPARAEEFLAMGYSVLATGTDVGLLGDAAAANAKFAAGLRAR